MRFVNPQFLYALVAVIIPVIIHLFNLQKHKTEVFSNVAFLREIKNSSRAKTTIKEWLILLSRMLAIACLVLAFTQPYKDNAATVKANDGHSIYLDNSYSSGAQLKGLSILAHHQTKANHLLQQLNGKEQIQLLSNTNQENQQFLYSANKVSELVNQITYSGNAKNSVQIEAQQSQAFQNQKIHHYWLSDFQKTQFPNLLAQIDSTHQYYLIPSQPASFQNLSVDSVWFDSPVKSVESQQRLYFRITNHGTDNSFDNVIQIVLNESNLPSMTINIPAQQYVDTFITYTNPKVGWIKGSVNINDGINTFDNTLFFSYEVLAQLPILEIYDQEALPIYPRIFERESYFTFTSVQVNNLNRSFIQEAKFIILNTQDPLSTSVISWLDDFVRNGGSISINPQSVRAVKSLNQLLANWQLPTYKTAIDDTLTITQVNQKSDVFKGVLAKEQPKTVQYPQVYSYYYTNKVPSNATPVLMANKAVLLLDYKVENGHVYQFNFGVNNTTTDYLTHELMLPTFYQMAFLSNKGAHLFYSVNSNFVRLEEGVSQDLIEIKSAEGDQVFAPQVLPVQGGTKLFLHHNITTHGHYSIWQGDRLLGWRSFNYPRTESSPTYYTIEELNAIKDSLQYNNVHVLDGPIDSLSKKLSQQQQGTSFWQWLVAVALLFLLIEIVLIRYFKPLVI